MDITPETDGKTHINIYSKGKTLLGRMLSNMSGYKIDTVDGRFDCVEGYWYWLATGCQHNELRTASGFKAKERGRELLKGFTEYPPADEFRLKITLALVSKLILNPEIVKELKKSSLPFTHYYVYSDKVIFPEGGIWLIDVWSMLRIIIKEYPNG